MNSINFPFRPFAMRTAAVFFVLCTCFGCSRQSDVKPAPRTQEARAVDELQAAIDSAPPKNAAAPAAASATNAAPAVQEAPADTKEKAKPKPKPEPMANTMLFSRL